MDYEDVPPRDPFSFGTFTPEFVDALSTRLAGLRVLEVFAGNGRLAAGLAARGVDIRATSLRSSHDGHAHGFLHPVEDLDALAAVMRHGRDSDVLLMSWPTTTEAAAAAVLEWGEDRPVLYVGEVTRFDMGNAGLGGCATDLFHMVTEIEGDLPGYRVRNRLERAVALRVRPECAARWRDGIRDKVAIAAPADAVPVP